MHYYLHWKPIISNKTTGHQWCIGDQKRSNQNVGHIVEIDIFCRNIINENLKLFLFYISDIKDHKTKFCQNSFQRHLKVYQHNEEMERSIVLIFTDIVLFDFVYTQLIDSPLTLSLRYHSPAKIVCKALKGFWTVSILRSD